MTRQRVRARLAKWLAVLACRVGGYRCVSFGVFRGEDIEAMFRDDVVTETLAGIR